MKVIVRVRGKVEMKKRERGKKGKLAEIEKKNMQRRDKSKKDAQGLKGQHHDIFYPRFYFTSQPYMVL